MFKRIRFLTAGESHGKGLACILEGIPSGLNLKEDDINSELKRRQGGYGRGSRMKIEQDRVEILSGVRWGKTLGSPILLLLYNKDWVNWQEGMSVNETLSGSIPLVTRPRPGHADLSGAVKYNVKDIRNILERSSARETAMRVAGGAVAKVFLKNFGISVYSMVISIGSVRIDDAFIYDPYTNFEEIHKRAENSPVRCPDEKTSDEMVRLIDTAISKGDTLGGVFSVIVTGVGFGLGSHIQWDLRLDARLAYTVMSIQAIKSVEIGKGMEMSRAFGSDVMDEIHYLDEKGFYRNTNFLGGIEGGISNAMPIVLKAGMKPIPTLKKPLQSVDIRTKETVKATYERSDACAVPAASVIGEAMVSLTILDAFLEKFGGDSMDETERNYQGFLNQVSLF
ncbi:MAG: chorismate synthase [Thermodesulfovibrionales bacterium]|nr:chorismate synthase [Thermodesulfovibrionales bacterium]